MSYAGPASRGKRARPLDIDPVAARLTPPSRSSHGDASGSGGFSTRPARHVSGGGSPSAASWAGPALFAAGIALGVALGAGGALLFAPRTGEETRHALKRQARRVGHRGHDAWEDLRDELWRARRRRKAARQRAREERETAETAD